MVNTEKPTTKQEQKKQAAVVKPKKTTQKPIVQKNTKKELEEKTSKIDSKEKKPQEETSKEGKSKKEKKPEKPKINKTEVSVKGTNLHISTKYSKDICRFIKKKQIDSVIKYLEDVLLKKKAIPMRGEIPHRKGKRMMSGRFPKKASENFIMLLKSLKSNALANEIENPVITEAFANIGNRPRGKFGRVKRKRTHVIIKAKKSIKK
ncbi:hypothetical protein ISS08_01910 [Candidatus Pacearchaeota archaeon]|nr:hypothetical protein [Candidatus Pacearchaeota archaeon]